MDKINNIWVGTDLSPRAAYALMRAAALAGEQQARLSALQVIPGAGGDYTFIEWLRLDPAIASRAESDIEQAAYMEMQRQVQALPAQVPTDVNVKIGSPHIKVVEQTRRAQADLIVVGAHGEGFVRDLLFRYHHRARDTKRRSPGAGRQAPARSPPIATFWSRSIFPIPLARPWA